MTDPALPTTTRPALLDAVTGEILTFPEGRELEAWTPVELAAFRDRLGDVKRMIDATLADVDEMLTAGLDRENTRSSRYGAFDVVTESPLSTVWDVPALSLALEALVQAGTITRTAAEKALEPQPPPPPKPRARELTKLLAHPDPAVIAAIDACRRAEPRARRRVTVTRAR